MSKIHRDASSSSADKSFVKEFLHPLMDDVMIDIERTFERDATETVLDWVEDNFSPDEVFEKDALDEWAEKNGYTKEA